MGAARMPALVNAEQEAWLEANTFYCERLKARITRKQCEYNQRLPSFGEDLRPMKGWSGTYSRQRKPIPCEHCNGSGKIKGRREKSMGMSPNIVQDTIRALQSSQSLAETAGKLNIKEGALRWRIAHSDEIYAAATELGLIRARSRVVRMKEGQASPPTVKPEIPAAPAEEQKQDLPCVSESPGSEPQRPTPPPDVVIDLTGSAVILGVTYTCSISLHKASL